MPTKLQVPGTKPVAGGVKRKPDYPIIDPKEFLKKFPRDKNFFILSIDGGGARGMIPAVILKEIERRSGKPISQLFDRICGTSTGSILACALTAPKSTGGRPAPLYRAADVVEIYRSLGSVIFSRGSLNESVIQPVEESLAEFPAELKDGWEEKFDKHPANFIALHTKIIKKLFKEVMPAIKKMTLPLHDVNKLAYVLHEKLGNLAMKDALVELFVYAYNIGNRTPVVLGSTESAINGISGDFSKFKMYQAATASSAAVPFFGPYKVYEVPAMPVRLPSPFGEIFPPVNGQGDQYQLVDGGNGGLANPALFAMLEDTPASKGKNKVVLSLGTGHFEEPISSATTQGGFLQWMGSGDLMNCLFDGESDTIDMAMRTTLGIEHYGRFQPEISKDLAFLDEGSVEDMKHLEDAAQTFISHNDELIDAWVEILNNGG
ncbi:MAG: patatin-like phospholipase family protein [Sideroxydans sp.]|nr:patatin-like phospholipase family protein [Sideroxydans sp.]